MALTDWRSLTSQGEIADLPASGFRYKYASDIVIYLTATPEAMAAAAAVSWSAAGLGMPAPGLLVRQVKASLKVHIETPQGERIFEQQVDLTYTFVAIIESAFAGLLVMGLFTWWIGSEKITTTICGHELEEGEEPQTLGAEQGYGDPASGSDYTADYAHMMGDWISPLYLLDIPAGSTFHIDFHNFGLAHLTYSYAAIQTQVIFAPAAFYRNPREGLLFMAKPGLSGMAASCWSAPLGSPPELSAANRFWHSSVGTSGGKSFWVPHVGGGRLALVWEGFGAILYAESNNEGDDGGWEGPTTVLSGHSLLGAARDKTGALHLLTRDGEGKVVGYACHRSPDADKLVEVGPPVTCWNETDGEGLNVTGVAYFDVFGGIFCVVTDTGGHLTYYEGGNGMATWRRGEEAETSG